MKFLGWWWWLMKMMMLTMTKQNRRSRSRRRRRGPWAAFSMSKCSQGWHQPPPQPSFQAEDDDVMFQGTCLVAVAVYFGDDEYAKCWEFADCWRKSERLSDASLQIASVHSTLCKWALLKCAHCVLFTSHSTLCTLEGLVLALAC